MATATQYDWKRCTDSPPLDTDVMTKIDDQNGCRNEQLLRLHQRTPESRPMWFFPDMSMYVYYTPTHWAHAHSDHNKG